MGPTHEPGRDAGNKLPEGEQLPLPDFSFQDRHQQSLDREFRVFVAVFTALAIGFLMLIFYVGYRLAVDNNSSCVPQEKPTGWDQQSFFSLPRATKGR